MNASLEALNLNRYQQTRSTRSIRRMVMITGLGAAILVSAGGCKASIPPPPEPTAAVLGTVQYQGHPVTSGTIAFYSLDGNESGEGQLAEKGAFHLPAPLAPGNYAVYFHRQGRPVPGLPMKYFSESTSEYSVQLTPGDNQISIELK